MTSLDCFYVIIWYKTKVIRSDPFPQLNPALFLAVRKLERCGQMSILGYSPLSLGWNSWLKLRNSCFHFSNGSASGSNPIMYFCGQRVELSSNIRYVPEFGWRFGLTDSASSNSWTSRTNHPRTMNRNKQQEFPPRSYFLDSLVLVWDKLSIYQFILQTNMTWILLVKSFLWNL